MPRLGTYVYGAAAIALGVIGIVWGDFATNWQRVQPDVPYRVPLAYIAAVCELCAGAAIMWRRSARAGALTLAILYSVFALLWVPKIVGSPGVYDVWGNFFEESGLVIAGVVAFLSLAKRDSLVARAPQVSRLFGICAISFALYHFFYLPGTASFVPKWIPPGQMFWAIATAVCFLLAAGAILSGILAGLAARLLTAMICGFEILVWLPMLFSAPHVHFTWAGNGIGLGLAGAAWVIADALSAPRKAASHPITQSAS